MLQTNFSALAAHSTYKKNQEQRNDTRLKQERGILAVVWAPGFLLSELLPLLLKAIGPLMWCSVISPQLYTGSNPRTG